MKDAGRPPGWWVEWSGPSPVRRESCEVGSRSRLSIPPYLTRLVPWLDAERPIPCLGVMLPAGIVRLLPWTDVGPRVVANAEALAQDPWDQTDDRSRERPLWLEARYIRVQLGPSGRLTLPRLVVHHLGGSEDIKWRVMVWSFPHHLELWSRRAYEDLLLRGPADLDEFP